MERSASFSDDKRYRYRLERVWDPDLPRVTWIMLNPSIASNKIDDQTVGKCVGFSQIWKAGSITIVNLYALISTDATQLARTEDPIGFWNDTHIRRAVAESAESGGLIVAAWGTHPEAPNFHRRVRSVINLPDLSNRQLDCLGTNRDRTPRHPLMLGYNTARIPWRVP